jgi:alanyl aminopeptidase
MWGRDIVRGLFLLGCACAAARPVAEAPSPATKPPVEEPVPALRLPADVRPLRYRLELAIDPEQPRFSGRVAIEVSLAAPRRVLWLHGRDLEVSAATVMAGGEALPARYEQVNDDGLVKLSLPQSVGPGPATLELAWSRAWDSTQVGLYLAPEGGRRYAFSQFEDIYARRAFPGFDEPGFKTPFEVTLVVPEGAVAVANTAPVGDEPAGPGRRRIHYAPTAPLPTYLLAWAVGPFDVVEAAPVPPSPVRSWPVPLRAITPKGRGAEAAFALDASRELLLREEAYFGIAYPYPKLDAVAVPDFAFGAMENAGEIHYAEAWLLATEGVTSEETRAQIVNTIAHEQAHQWFGDLVTMPWWEDAWLNESFATWMAAGITEAWRPELRAAVDLRTSLTWAMNNDALTTARAIRQPLTSLKNIPDQFDVLTYQKGGGVLAMFERFVGAEAFRRGVSDYLAAHAHGSGSTDALLASLSRTAGKDVAPAFHSFLDQAGVPLVEASVSCGAGPALTLKQSRYAPLGTAAAPAQTWQVPVCARYALGGRPEERCTLLQEPQVKLPLPGCPRWLIPDADGAAYLRWTLPGDDLRRLMSQGYGQLSVKERIALASNLLAAVKAGSLPIADALAALGPIAADPEGEVASEAVSLLDFARERVLPPGQRALTDAYVVQLFAPVLKRLGTAGKKGEPASVRRLRVAALGALTTAGSPEAVREATRLGRAYAGVADGRFHPEAVDPDLAELVLGVAVEHGDRAFFEALQRRLPSVDDADLRGRILTALGQARDPDRAAAALALALDPGLRKQEGLTTLFAQVWDHRTRDGAWRFLLDHVGEIEGKVPATLAAYLPSLGRAYCDPEHAAQIPQTFAPRADRIPGMAKVTRQAEESVRLCAAQAAAQRESAQAFFQRRAAPPVKAPLGN